MGRVDDVLNVSGHRLSTMESGIGAGRASEGRRSRRRRTSRRNQGAGVSAFVTLESGIKATPETKEELRAWVAKEIGSLAKPDDIRFTDSLPKTRSGKIMRRLLRELATDGEVKGDMTTLEDFT